MEKVQQSVTIILRTERLEINRLNMPKFVLRMIEGEVGSMSIMIGRVKWFNNEKGYGFIEYNEGEDIFVHYSAINNEGYKTLTEGQFVEFNLVDTTKGFQALEVTLVKEPAITK